MNETNIAQQKMRNQTTPH